MLGERFRDGLRFTGIPTVDRERGAGAIVRHPTDRLSPTDTPIDLTIDGADEIGEARPDLIKGMGGALLREKIVAASEPAGW